MQRKIVLMDKDLFDLVLARCRADQDLGKSAIRRAPNIRTGRALADYVVLMRRLQAALEAARDEQ